MNSKLFKLHRGEEGSGMIEYAILATLVALAGIVGVSGVGITARGVFNNVGYHISQAGIEGEQGQCTPGPGQPC